MKLRSDHAALGYDGSLWRSDAFDHPQRHRPVAAARDRAHSRSRLSSVRDATGHDRQGTCDRCSARSNLLLVWRYAARPAAARTCCASRARAAACASSIRRSMRSSWRRQSTSPNRLLRHRLRDHGPCQRHGRTPSRGLGLDNFSMLVSHVRVPPAISAIMESPGNRVQAFLAAGHVCSVMGYWEYESLLDRFGVPSW